jgi:UDP:flavonoid glycosyltransferase YjiC (YdhE family)
LAKELVRRGHEVTMLANENWGELAREAGATFYPIAREDPSQSDRDDNAFFINATIPAFRKSFDYVASRVAENPHVLLIYRANMLGMESAAEKYGLRHVKVALQPSSIKSLARPPWPMTSLAKGPFSALARTTLVPLLYQLVEWRRGHFRHRNIFRASVGLPPHKMGRMGAQTEDLTLLLTPKWFATPAEDWAENLVCPGFLFWDEPREEPAIDAFVSKHGPPLVFTPGSGVSDVAHFFEKAIDVCAASGLPGILLSRQAFSGKAAGIPVLKLDFADLAGVLPKARLLVHHGGIGTTAQALRAGIPQVIVPDRFDQPDNAIRIANLGLGAAIMKDDQPPASWANLIRHLCTDVGTRRRLKAVSAAIAKEHALERSCDRIEELLRKGAER